MHHRPVAVALLAGIVLVVSPPARCDDAGRAAMLAASPIDRLDLPWWKARFAAKQAALDHGRYDLVYYGDSITQNFEGSGASMPPAARAQADWAEVWQRFYGDRQAINLGFRGDTTASLLWRIDHGEGDIHASSGNPKVAILLIGANNMGKVHWPANATLAGIAADIGAIQAHLPQTRILLMSVLPSDRSDWITQTTRSVNQALAARYGGSTHGKVVYVDVTKALETDGSLDRSLFVDPLLTPPQAPLHPTAEGATRVAAAIEPTLSTMLGDRRH